MNLTAQNNVSTQKILIVHFSWAGNTRKIAEKIHARVGGDLVELKTITPYSSNYNTVLDQARKEQSQQARPALRTCIENIEQYNIIILGYPNWWASIPMPIATFLETYDLSGKKIIPFCSHGGGRLGQSVSAIAKLAPDSEVLEPLAVQYDEGANLDSEIDRWLSKNGLVVNRSR
jgi:flavodoxin